METFSALLAICAGNSPVPGEFPAQRPVTRSFDVFYDLRLNKRLSKQSWGWWFETLSCPLWRHFNVVFYKIWIESGLNGSHITQGYYRTTGNHVIIPQAHTFNIWFCHSFLAQPWRQAFSRRCGRTSRGDCQSPLKTMEIPTGHLSPQYLTTEAFSNLWLYQPITNGRYQPTGGHVPYTTDSLTTTRWGLCSSLLQHEINFIIN